MSTPASQATAVNPSTLITVKVLYNDNTRRFKIPLKELEARVFPQKLRQLLGIPADVNVTLERLSDSAGRYIHLDSENNAVYKQLYRAAKAKLKLRIKVTEVDNTASQSPLPTEDSEHQDQVRCSYLQTVLSSPLPEGSAKAVSEPPRGAAEPTPTEAEVIQWSNTGVVAPEPQYQDFSSGPDNLNTPVVSHKSPTGVFCIDCNHCGLSIPNEHYHCSICDDGDYDLCLHCVDSGVTCPNEDHWLIRRIVKDGIVTNSTTETVAPRKLQVEAPKEAPEKVEKTPELVQEAVSRDTPKTLPVAPEVPVHLEARICNACLKEFNETKIVTCLQCKDYDLCITCLLKDAHGHHPAHNFSLLHDGPFCLKNLVLSRCKPGRRYQHAAICDGCEKNVVGVRHKCLTCPDWDYCSECFANASETHPGHRFAPLYEAISEPSQAHDVHYGIFCDGPLCKNRAVPGYISGVRYKCSVCYDLDFCASCEALPTNTHNRTHPMVMLKTPVRDVTVSTLQEDRFGGSTVTLGDRAQKSSSNQAISSVKPQATIPDVPVKEESEVPQGSEPVKQESPLSKEQPNKAEKPTNNAASGYDALFVRDTIPDNTIMSPNEVFHQTWTLYNPGPLAWPAGSDVRFVGGDSMFNVDTNHPLSLDSVSAAMESTKLAEPLESGQSADFIVTLKAPSRVGTAISYWRLKLPNGMPFGHRLWCEIQVREDSSSSIKGPFGLESEGKTSPGRTESQMIFPKLEKESPEASAHEGGIVAPVAPSVSNPSEQDILEDVESLSLGDHETENGFLTDEEYDILDASDQEYMDAKSRE
ncbi:hypothetical protein BDV26DRAFT_275928 [Aspergillus bertholletiae]|uniref:ZZ-type domain-containing protein n=1 Tax=Aspergillus bertholletiae TaxID=1226010 RepID=A0A5N7ARJ7_9EURO|nr:hypothetical protein BDV26DRAFT_275928 [Aspergillus bertholletiae]